MSPIVRSTHFEEQREILERRANLIRARLLRTIDALDHRRHQISEIRKRARSAVVPVAIALLGAGALAVGAVFVARAAIRRRRSHLVDSARALTHRLRGLTIERRRSFARDLLQRVTTSAVTIVVAELVRRTTKNAFDGRLPDGRLVARDALAARRAEGAR